MAAYGTSFAELPSGRHEVDTKEVFINKLCAGDVPSDRALLQLVSDCHYYLMPAHFFNLGVREALLVAS